MYGKIIARIQLRPIGFIAALALLTGIGCEAPHPGKTQFAATISPLAFILNEIAGSRAEIVTLLSPGASPHTYEISPADARTVGMALALFYVDDTLDGWAARLPARAKVRVFDWAPEESRLVYSGTHTADDGHGHDHGEFDPHFWSDPVLVRAMLPHFVEKMSALDPDGAEEYRDNGVRFAAELEAIDERLRAEMEPLKGKAIVTFHPSWDYFLKRYGIRNVGVLEPAPGKEASPQQIMNLVESIRAEGVKAVFSEPQLPSRPAEVLAETAGVTLGVLDPHGGAPGRTTYRALLEFNAQALRDKLQ